MTASGVPLLTDDGALIHWLTHPKKHVDKVYEITCARPATGEFTLRMMLTEGKQLHQTDIQKN